MKLAPLLLLTVSTFAPATTHAQISLTTSVDAALRNSPRLKVAEADVAKARALLAQAKDVFIPAITAGAAIGDSFGYSTNPPTLFNITAQSLGFSFSQLAYIHSASAGYNSARRSFEDVRQSIAEDTALTFLALEHDQQREEVLRQQAELSDRLVTIVQDRADAGLDSRMDLLNAQLSASQLRLARLRAQDETANDRTHLASLTGRPAASLRAQGEFPAISLGAALEPSHDIYANPAVEAAFLNARAKQQAALGDAKYLYRPQFGIFVQYNRYATFTDSFKALRKINPTPTAACEIDPNGPNCTVPVGANEEAFGVQFTLPLFDRGHRDRARETVADASHALHEAELAQITALEGQAKLRHTLEEFEAQAESASLSQQLAQAQLEIVQLQLTAPIAGAAVTTPKDEQNARIAEKEKYLAVVDTSFQLHQAQISLLRQTGRLLDWLALGGLPTPPPPPMPTLKHP